MALSITTNYVGQSKTQAISAALYAPVEFSLGLIKVVPNIIYKEAIPRFDFGNLLQADGSSWNASGTLTRTEKYLTPVKFKVNFEYPIHDFETSWEADKMSGAAIDLQADATLASYINSLMIKQVGQQWAKALWVSNWTGYTNTSISASTNLNTIGSFTGFLSRIDADSPNRVTATAFTKSNIVTNMEAVYNAIPASVRGKSVMAMSVTSLALYKQALAAQGSIGNLAVDQASTYLGMPVYGFIGMPDNHIVTFVPASAGDNVQLYFGTNLLSDITNEVRIIDMRDNDGSDVFRYKMRMFADTAVGYGSESVLCR